MRFFLILLLLTISAACTNQSTTQISNNSSNQNVSGNSNKAEANKAPDEETIHANKIRELDVQNEQYRVVPDEFKNVDFKNFTYPAKYPAKFITLKDGEYEYHSAKTMGGGWVSFDGVYYVDLTGDSSKEAIVFINRIDCGGSCSGGADLIYFYTVHNKKPKLIGHFQAGALAGGCALKSLTIRDKRIEIEQFGKCTIDTDILDVYNDKNKNPSKDSGSLSCKFCVKDKTKSVYRFDHNRLLRESIETADSPDRNIMNYIAEVAIYE